MFQYDFSNHQNRHIRITDMPAEYFQRIQETTRNDPYYPVWHIAPKCGLMNDPNGLCEINGIHHIFYQWFPAGPVHGLKHWYHLTTKDFIHYEDHGVAMYPDTESDSFGCYTGMALKEGEQVQVFYTGIENEEMIPCTCYARFDGEKLTDRKKIVEMDPNQTTMNYRDPYVWKRDSEYWMLTGAESKEHEGILMLYRGKQADSYEYAGRVRLLQNGQEAMLGYMLECPNYYEENQKGVLFCSPMGISSENKYDYKNVFSVAEERISFARSESPVVVHPEIAEDIYTLKLRVVGQTVEPRSHNISAAIEDVKHLIALEIVTGGCYLVHTLTHKVGYLTLLERRIAPP